MGDCGWGGGEDLALDGGLVLELHPAGEGGGVLLHELLENFKKENAFLFRQQVRLVNSFLGPFFEFSGTEIGSFLCFVGGTI